MKWITVCRHKLYAGLGMLNLQATSEALRVCWLWQSCTEPGKPWHGIPIPTSPAETKKSLVRSSFRPVDDKVKDLFVASVMFHLGDGHQLMFSTEGCLRILAPTLFQTCKRKRLTVAQAIDDHRWTRHLKRGLSPLALAKWVLVLDKLQGVALHPGRADSVIWSFTAYAAQFARAAQTNYIDYIWQDLRMACGSGPRCQRYAAQMMDPVSRTNVLRPLAIE